MIASAVVAAQVSQSRLAIKNLRKAQPEVEWNEKSAVGADVNCDGRRETIVLGKQKNNVVIAVVSGQHQNDPQLMSFPIGGGAQNAFCGIPLRVELSTLQCNTDIGPLPGCKKVRGCQEFTVVDDECDGFNFYWDSSRKSLQWWRH